MTYQNLYATMPTFPESYAPMTIPNDTKLYTYPRVFLLAKIAALLIFVTGLIGLPLSLLHLLRFASTGIARPLWDQVILALTLLVSFLVGGIGMNTPPEVRLQQDGLVVEVLLLSQRFIPWHDILEIRYHTYGLTRIPYAVVVVRSGLTIWHALHATIVGYAGKHVFIIHGHMKGYPELLETIEHHLERAKS